MDTGYASYYANLEAEHWWWRARRKIVTSHLKERLPAQARVLEIGCGAGTNLAAWMSCGFRCEGIEPDAGLRATARQRTRLDIRPGSLPYSLPELEKGSYDAVLLLDVLEHVEDDAAGLRTTVDLLQPGGWIFLNVPALPSMWSVHDEINHHYRRYLRSNLKKLIQTSGLRCFSIRYWGGSLLPLAWANRRAGGRQSEEYSVPVPPRWINRSMEAWTLAEYQAFKLCPFFPGLSLFAVARK